METEKIQKKDNVYSEEKTSLERGSQQEFLSLYEMEWNKKTYQPCVAVIKRHFLLDAREVRSLQYLGPNKTNERI